MSTEGLAVGVAVTGAAVAAAVAVPIIAGGVVAYKAGQGAIKVGQELHGLLETAKEAAETRRLELLEQEKGAERKRINGLIEEHKSRENASPVSLNKAMSYMPKADIDTHGPALRLLDSRIVRVWAETRAYDSAWRERAGQLDATFNELLAGIATTAPANQESRIAQLLVDTEKLEDAITLEKQHKDSAEALLASAKSILETVAGTVISDGDSSVSLEVVSSVCRQNKLDDNCRRLLAQTEVAGAAGDWKKAEELAAQAKTAAAQLVSDSAKIVSDRTVELIRTQVKRALESMGYKVAEPIDLPGREGWILGTRDGRRLNVAVDDEGRLAYHLEGFDRSGGQCECTPEVARLFDAIAAQGTTFAHKREGRQSDPQQYMAGEIAKICRSMGLPVTLRQNGPSIVIDTTEQNAVVIDSSGSFTVSQKLEGKLKGTKSKKAVPPVGDRRKT